MTPEQFIVPEWPAPANVHALVTTRRGGTSAGPWNGFNLADHVGDDPAAVAANRALLRGMLPAEPVWLRQGHGTRCIDAALSGDNEADAACARVPGVVCAVLTADCLPLLLCDEAGTVVAAVHAGWRGLAAGVIESALDSMGVPGEQVLAWLGPAIGPKAFEVGEEVREIFIARDPLASSAFVPHGRDKWLCDLYRLARQRLAARGVRRIWGSCDAPAQAGNPSPVPPDSLDADGRQFCTATDRTRFFSYRRDGQTGRMASLIWLS